MNRERIFWFQDGLKLKAPQETHGAIDAWSRQLIDTAGDRRFEHIPVDPFLAADRLKESINSKDFSAVIDLSGSIGELLVGSAIPVVTDIHTSRLRNVSSERLDGIGNLFSKPIEDLREKIHAIDLTRPLITDDVCWSGRTIEATLQNLAIDPAQATLACLVANTGNFNAASPGGKQRLEGLGMHVISALDVSAPSDDGFHIEDFLFSRDVTPETAFDIAVDVQYRRQSLGEVRKEIEAILRSEQKTLFPHAIDSVHLKALTQQGRAQTPNGIPRKDFFDINPPNWLQPSWAKRASWDQLFTNSEVIVQSLQHLRGDL